MLMGSCAVKSSRRNLVDQGQGNGDINQVVQILINTTYGDLKCPVCLRPVENNQDPELHLVMCLTKPRLHYNEETITKSRGAECIICLEDLKEEDVIARLPCLCVYHKHCIDQWFQVNRSCPQHPTTT